MAAVNPLSRQGHLGSSSGYLMKRRWLEAGRERATFCSINLGRSEEREGGAQWSRLSQLEPQHQSANFLPPPLSLLLPLSFLLFLSLSFSFPFVSPPCSWHAIMKCLGGPSLMFDNPYVCFNFCYRTSKEAGRCSTQNAYYRERARRIHYLLLDSQLFPFTLFSPSFVRSSRHSALT